MKNHEEDCVNSLSTGDAMVHRPVLKAKRKSTSPLLKKEKNKKDAYKEVLTATQSEVTDDSTFFLNEVALPEDELLPMPWKKCFQQLVDNVNVLATELIKEKTTSRKYREEVDALKDRIVMLTKEVEASKQWQTLVYNELQKVNVYSVQNEQRLSTVETYVKTSLSNRFVDETARDGNTQASNPVIYGDSSISQKLSSRRRLPAGRDEKVAQEKKSSNGEELVEQTAKLDGVKITDDQEYVREKSIAETLKEAAESVCQTNGLTYDETSGLYYDWNTKMYYDPSTKLYYDHDNGIYYHYDLERKSYLFHSQISLSSNHSNSKEEKVLEPTAYLSEGELSSDDDTPNGNYTDPCVRLIVVQSEVIDVGTLFIVTCKGGSIGREPTNLIRINEQKVSREHAWILYDTTERMFFIQDRKTASGTFINNERIANSRDFSEPVEITHRDFLKIGDTRFSVHIHLGHETCADCEPGNIQAIVSEKKKKNVDASDDLDAQRKKELKSMRKKYGITPGYLPKNLLESIPDRAESRRKNVGSAPYENVDKPLAKASIHEEISEQNKGHKMLAKMGWKAGEGLGKTKTGITQPIGVEVLEKRKGLGCSTKKDLQNAGVKSKKDKWSKARQRYEQLENE